MHISWNEMPMWRLLLPYSAGIVGYTCYPWLPAWQLLFFISPFFVAGILLFRKATYSFQFRYQWVAGCMWQGLLIAAGYLLCQLYMESGRWQSRQVFQKGLTETTGIVAEILQEKNKTYKTILQVQREGHKADLITYLQKSSAASMLLPGQRIQFNCTCQAIQNKGNPGEMDYAGYCARNHWYYSVYLRDSQWRQVTASKPGLFIWFRRQAGHVIKLLRRYITDPVATGFAEALLIGYRYDLDADTWQAYARTGIVHIIAISGMHMAMVYEGMKRILICLPVFRKRKKTVMLVALCFMWVFAALTGLPPSVCRAAFMFTLLGGAECLGWDMHPLNNLSASAFCLLLIQPMWLLDPGFQLSYAAILSLHVFYKPLYTLYTVRVRVLRRIWQTMASSLAAQVLTFPLCIYYFHQFPWYFLPANLLAIPGSVFILYAEIFLLLVCPFKNLARFTGTLLSQFIHLLNQGIHALAVLPGGLSSGLNWSTLQVISIYLFIGCIYRWLRSKKVVCLLYALACMSAFLFLAAALRYSSCRQAHMVVMHTGKFPDMYWIKGEKGDRLCIPGADTGLTSSSETRTAINRYYHTRIDQHDVQQAAVQSDDLQVWFLSQHLSMARVRGIHFDCRKRMPLRYLIIGSGFHGHLSWLLQRFNPGEIILDTDLPLRTAKQLYREALQVAVPIHVVAAEGAFVGDL